MDFDKNKMRSFLAFTYFDGKDKNTDCLKKVNIIMKGKDNVKYSYTCLDFFRKMP